ncbi:serine/threonine-protein kinase [Streptomyces sp. Tu 3180]|uniref:serine/threonine-protein kinase n=1 Tax=Streptomyces sp. Tu 3180 TaxID=2682611 RepID=UPI001356D46E|nr:serine/threonine-protein kinase [Streptomyces sp. Tu 3180]KAF3468539.1 protein kinase [Streptomyces sp. Tu 3180]
MEGLEPTDPQQVSRYRISALLGTGGMGRVFLGRSPSGRLVAVKVVRPELAEDPGFRRRFAREVAAARKVTGFFTAAVVDADPDGSPPWLATAYVPGMALDQAVAAHGPWPTESVRALGAGLAEALEAIHAAGLVHRDLKPSNVLIAPDGPRVVDFGISVATESTSLTRAGTILGTPGFMAPEQLTGGSVTPATDVFAFGAVLTYVATGTGPFGTGSAQSLNFRIAYEEPRLDQLPGPGLEIIAHCLAKEPADRPSVNELIGELAQLADPSGYTPTEVVTEAAVWLPDQVARALPATVGAPAAPAPRTPKPDVAPPASPPAPPARSRRGAAPSISDRPTTVGPATTPAQATRSTPGAAARPEPSTRPATATKAAGTRPRPARAAQAPVVTAPPSALRRALPFWVAGAALVLSLFLPFYWGTTVLTSLFVPYWMFSEAWVLGGAWPFALVAVFAGGTCAAVLLALRRSPWGPVPRRIRLLHLLSTTLTTALFAFWVGIQLADSSGLSYFGSGAWFLALGCAALIRSAFRLRVPKRVPTS